MARKTRMKSNTGIYHIMLRGINRQTIFIENEDYERFIEKLLYFKEICRYELFAYCLMSNHLHLLLKEGVEELGLIFRRIGASYVHWYNQKYHRIGHLFQDRFKSEVVENDEYFLALLRYIHQNPIKASIVTDMAQYPWSSYKEYVGKNTLCNVSFSLKLFSDDKKSAIKLFEKFCKEKNNDQFLEDEPTRIYDIEALQIAKSIAEIENPQLIKEFEREKRNKIIRQLKNERLSIRQIERITGVSLGIIRRL